MANRAPGNDFTLERALPNNVEAERFILGAILLENTTLNQAAEHLKPDDFFLVSHRRIFEKMLALFETGRGIDPITLQEELRRAAELDLVGGPAYVASLFDGVPRFSNIENYVGIVKGKSMLRKLIGAANHIMAKAFDDEEPPEEILDEAERLILSIAEDRIKQGFVHIGEVAAKQLALIEETAGREQLITGIATGFNDLDYMTSGLQRGDLIIIAARPSMGKCLAADAEIVLADGRIATIEEIYQRREAELLTLGDDFKFKLTRPSTFVDDGIKPVYRVTTRLGRFVDSTLSHPYLTIDGWRKLLDLNVGDRVAVSRLIDVFGERKLRQTEIESLARDSRDDVIPSIAFQLVKPQLAHFLHCLFAVDGEGVNSDARHPRVCYASEKLARQIQHLLLRFGIVATLERKDVRSECRTSWRLEIADNHSIRLFAEEIGKAANHQNASGPVRLDMGLNPPNGSWGMVKARPIPGDGPRPNPPNGSWGMFKVRPIPGDGPRPNPPNGSWGMFKVQPSLVARGERLDFNDPPTAVGGIQEKLVRRCGLDYNDPPTAVGGISGSDPTAVGGRAGGDVYWDEIVSIEYLGDKQVYDLTIPETHNFVANDICVHNTAFSLNIAQNAATTPQHHGEKAVVGVFSLEMSNEQLVNRMLCSQARVDAHRLRSGYLSKDEWRRLATGVGELSEALIYLDDTPGISVLEMRAKARRLKNELKRLDLLIVDYLQLMTGRGRSESRQQEVSQISRELKMLAKELNVPLVALSQLSRAPETRTGSHKPQLSDLRESGCLAGESLVTMADSGAQVPIRDLVGKSGFIVWALNDATFKLEPAVVSRAFATGVKPVFRLTTRLGRSIRATANHEFRTFAGWRRLDELRIGERLALPRVIENPVPQSMSNDELALLGHLIGDGCTLPRHVIQYTTREKDLAEIVADLARKVFGGEVEPRINPERTWYQVYLSSTRHHTHNVRSAVAEWLSDPGVWGLRSYEKRVPAKVFEQPAEAIGVFPRPIGRFTNIRHQNMSRDRAERVAQAIGLETLTNLAQSDVYWDAVIRIESDGADETFDLTVEKHHNFLANDIITHNSLEQDADVVMFIYREEVYKPETEKQNIAEIIIGKQRNGPIGSVELVFLKQLTRFEDKFRDQAPEG
jgi:replicative DNA helicase